MSIGPLTRFNYNRTAAGPAGAPGAPGAPGANGSSFYTPTLDPSSAAVVAGDSVVSANQALNANVTRAITASILNSTSVPGVVVIGGNPGTTITVQVSGVCANSITGLGTGSVAKVAINGTTGKLVRVLVPDGSEKIVGSCDGQGNLTLAPVDHVGSHAHLVINVAAAPYNCVGDGVTDNSAGIQAACDQAYLTGRSVYFPGQGSSGYGGGSVTGTFAIAKPINVKSGVRLFGDLRIPDASQSEAAAGIKCMFPVVSGTAAAITAVNLNPNPNQATIRNIVTITGLSGLTVNNVQVGDSILLSNCASGNAGTLTIVSINIAGQSVTAANYNYAQITTATLASSPDYGTGGTNIAPAIGWTLKPPMLRMYGYGMSIEGLRFDGNNRCGAIVDSTGGVADTSTDVTFSFCSFWRGVYGVKIGDFGPNALYRGNCDLHRFEHCYFWGHSFACVFNPNDTAQSRDHFFTNTDFSYTPYGYWFYSSSFHMLKMGGSVCGNNAYSGFGSYLYGSVVQPSALRDGILENCGRLWQGTGVSTGARAILFDAIRFDSNPADVYTDREVIQASAVSGLNVKNCLFGTQGSLNLKIGILNAGVPGGAPVHAIVENCSFARDSDTNIVQARGDTGGTGTWYSLGNLAYNGGSYDVAVHDGFHTIGVGTLNPFDALVLGLPSTLAVLPTPNGVNHLTDLFTTTNEYINSTGAFSIGSMAGGYEGRELEFNYYGAHAMTILHQDGTEATTTKRFDSPTGANIVFPAGNACFFARWSTQKGMWEVTSLGPTYTAGGAPTGAAGGSLAGTYPNPTLATTGVGAATYGDSTHVAQVTIGADGRVSAASNVTITGAAPTGAAGGVLTGTYPNPGMAATGVGAASYGDSTHVAQVTVGADGRITAASSTVIAADVALGGFSSGYGSPKLIQNPRTSDAATQTLALTAQDAFPGAVTNTKGGQLILTAGASGAGGAGGLIQILGSDNAGGGANQGNILVECGLLGTARGVLSVIASAIQGNGGPFAFGQAGVSITPGTVTLAANQYNCPVLVLTGTTPGGGCTIIFPDQPAQYQVVMQAVTLNNGLTFKAGSSPTVTFTNADLTTKNQIWQVITSGSGNIAVRN